MSEKSASLKVSCYLVTCGVLNLHDQKMRDKNAGLENGRADNLHVSITISIFQPSDLVGRYLGAAI